MIFVVSNDDRSCANGASLGKILVSPTLHPTEAETMRWLCGTRTVAGYKLHQATANVTNPDRRYFVSGWEILEIARDQFDDVFDIDGDEVLTLEELKRGLNVNYVGCSYPPCFPTLKKSNPIFSVVEPDNRFALEEFGFFDEYLQVNTRIPLLVSAHSKPEAHLPHSWGQTVPSHFRTSAVNEISQPEIPPLRLLRTCVREEKNFC